MGPHGHRRPVATQRVGDDDIEFMHSGHRRGDRRLEAGARGRACTLADLLAANFLFEALEKPAQVGDDGPGHAVVDEDLRDGVETACRQPGRRKDPMR
ncbi:MAG TPA: hypothetical protein VMO26_24740 [Vicinamibacterales bacterium]|nr:hypothetical protein [Vicinamibacterales bacterium]